MKNRCVILLGDEQCAINGNTMTTGEQLSRPRDQTHSPDPTRRLLAAWDLWAGSRVGLNRRAEESAWSALYASVEAIRTQIAQGQPTAAELLSELVTAVREWELDPTLESSTTDRLIALRRRAQSLGYGAPKAVTL